MKRYTLLIVTALITTASISSVFAKTNYTINIKTANSAAKSAQALPASVGSVSDALATATTQINTALQALDNNDIAATLTALQDLSKTIPQVAKSTKSACKAAQSASKIIKPLSHAEEIKIIQAKLATLQKQTLNALSNGSQPSIELVRETDTLKQQLANVQQQQVQDRKAAHEASKNFITFSNALGGRVHIFAAHASRPTVFGKNPVKTIKKDQPTFLLQCSPDNVYKIEIENQFGKLKMGKKGLLHQDKKYRTLHRSGSKVDTFSVKDRGHQLIIDNYHNYSVHTMDYKGKGSIKQARDQNIGLQVAFMVVTTLVSIALFQPELLGLAGSEVIAEGTTETALVVADTSLETTGDATVEGELANSGISSHDSATDVRIGTEEFEANSNTEADIAEKDAARKALIAQRNAQRAANGANATQRAGTTEVESANMITNGEVAGESTTNGMPVNTDGMPVNQKTFEIYKAFDGLPNMSTKSEEVDQVVASGTKIPVNEEANQTPQMAKLEKRGLVAQTSRFC